MTRHAFEYVGHFVMWSISLRNLDPGLYIRDDDLFPVTEWPFTAMTTSFSPRIFFLFLSICVINLNKVFRSILFFCWEMVISVIEFGGLAYHMYLMFYGTPCYALL